MDCNNQYPDIQRMVDELRRKHSPKVIDKPVEPSEIDQDAGGGYNPDGTIPQV